MEETIVKKTKGDLTEDHKKFNEAVKKAMGLLKPWVDKEGGCAAILAKTDFGEEHGVGFGITGNHGELVTAFAELLQDEDRFAGIIKEAQSFNKFRENLDDGGFEKAIKGMLDDTLGKKTEEQKPASNNEVEEKVLALRDTTDAHIVVTAQNLKDDSIGSTVAVFGNKGLMIQAFKKALEASAELRAIVKKSL